MLSIVYMYPVTVLQMFGSQHREEKRIKGLYMYGSVGEPSVSCLHVHVHMYLFLTKVCAMHMYMCT